jgi:hypothetical protein
MDGRKDDAEGKLELKWRDSVTLHYLPKASREYWAR